MLTFLMGDLKCFLGFIRVILIVGFPRIILFGIIWFVENGVLVRQLCRVDQKLRPLLYNPSVDLSWQTIRELFQLTTSFNRFMSMDASSPSIQLSNGSASRNAKFEYVSFPNLFKVRNFFRWNSGTRSYARSNAALSVS